MTVSLITINSPKDEGVNTRVQPQGKKLSSSHKFSTLLNEKNPSANEPKIVHSPSVKKNKGDISPKKSETVSHKEHALDQHDSAPSLKEGSRDKDISTKSDPGSMTQKDSSDDQKDTGVEQGNLSQEVQLSAQSQTLSMNAASVPVPQLDNQPASDDSSSPILSSSRMQQTSLQTVMSLHDGQDQSELYNIKESGITFTPDKTNRNITGDFQKNNNISISDVSLEMQETREVSQEKTSLFTLQKQTQSGNEMPDSPNVMAELRSSDDQDALEESGDLKKDIKGRQASQSGHKTKSSSSSLEQNSLTAMTGDDALQHVSGKDMLFGKARTVNDETPSPEKNLLKDESVQTGEKDENSLSVDGQQGGHFLSNGAAKQAHNAGTTATVSSHKDVGMAFFEADNALLPKATHIPSTLNMTLTTDDKTPVHIQLTRLEDNLATLSLQGTDEATTEALKKTRHDLVSHLDAAGVQSANIKIAVLPTDTSTMTGEKGHGSFDNGGAFAGFSDQRQNEQNSSRQEWHSAVINSVETLDSPTQNERSSIVMEQTASSTFSSPSDMRRRGINISV